MARQSEYPAGGVQMTADPSSWWFMCAQSAVASRSNNPVISARGSRDRAGRDTTIHSEQTVVIISLLACLDCFL